MPSYRLATPFDAVTIRLPNRILTQTWNETACYFCYFSCVPAVSSNYRPG
jgi:hypothetical protein